MGNCLAPAYTSLFMGTIEEHMSSPTWKRYTDDIFIVATRSVNEWIFRVNPTKKFTYEAHLQEVTFLDVTVYMYTVITIVHQGMYFQNLKMPPPPRRAAKLPVGYTNQER